MEGVTGDMKFKTPEIVRSDVALIPSNTRSGNNVLPTMYQRQHAAPLHVKFAALLLRQ